jgi:hypothetical protein
MTPKSNYVEVEPGIFIPADRVEDYNAMNDDDKRVEQEYAEMFPDPDLEHEPYYDNSSDFEIGE